MCESEDVHTVIVNDEIETKGKECLLGEFNIFTATEGNYDKEFIAFKRCLTTEKLSESPFQDRLLFDFVGIKFPAIYLFVELAGLLGSLPRFFSIKYGSILVERYCTKFQSNGI